MAKIFSLLAMVVSFTHCAALSPSSEFDRSCAACHAVNAPDLQNIYSRYLQTYGSEKRSKKAMHDYLIAPKIETSIMPAQALAIFGLHPVMPVKNLDSLLKVYFERYDVKKRIKFKAVGKSLE